ncbi:hypothetical protein FB45DRAFT_947776 [Roridomyces roridus]|uniref:Aip3p/Bud6 N-terminal domain-containing protein n=1 Tax=Roridomyces roridus TaxID=1738132 RepID=A0AAD7F7S3_9AGAR|nr:hypothetical protein FB45DRAFT_947776 [Roridomyces roridus]
MYEDYNPSSRTSTSSSNSSQGYPVTNDTGDVPTAVRNLLLSTKQLQQALSQWSLGQFTETQVSDIYVQVGTDFNSTIQAFAQHRIDLSEIYSVPKELRDVLEQCLAEDPSPEVLASFMPDIRRVLVMLLRGLQSKQNAWRTRNRVPPPPRPSQASATPVYDYR